MTSRSFRRYTLGTATGLLADQMYFVALGWTAAESNGGDGASAVLTAGASTRLAVLLLGGVIADRVGPKMLAVGSDIARALLMATVGAVIWIDEPSLQVLVLLSAIFGVVDAMFIPAIGALPAQFGTADEASSLQSIRMAAQRFSLIVGAPLAGILVGLKGFALVLTSNALLFLLSAALVSKIEIHSTAAEVEGEVHSLWGDVIAGIRYVSLSPVLRAVVMLTAVTELCLAGVFNVGLPLLSLERGWGPEGAGILLGAFGGGAAAAAVFVASRGVGPAGLVACISIAAIGPGLALAAVASDFGVAFAAFALTGASAGLCSPLLIGLATTLPPPEIQGKVMSIVALASFAGVPISYGVTGVAADQFGILFPFTLSGLAALVVGTSAIFLRPIRTARLP